MDNTSFFFTTVLALSFLSLLYRAFFSRLVGKLPPGPPPLPIFGNWLRFRHGLTPRNLSSLAQQYGDVFMLQMGQRKVLVVSSPDMAKEVLQTQGIEFGSRARNMVFDMTTGQGQDMVFADYGEHWRKMRRIATLPFFTTKVVQQSRHGWKVRRRSALFFFIFLFFWFSFAFDRGHAR